MPREFTVILKDERPADDGKKTILARLNAVVGSPLFVFFIGSSAIAFFPTIRGWMYRDQVALEKVEAQARADAALIAPFISNLDDDKRGRFDASRAALLALEAAASAANGGKSPPMYAAVNKAIDAAAPAARPKPPQLDAASARKVEAAAKEVVAAASGAQPSIDLLSTGTLVYIEVDRNDAQSKAYANSLWKALKAASVLAPGVEELSTATMPKRTQVRYYHPEDKTKAEVLAEKVSKITGSTTLLAKPPLEAKPGTLEVWFGTEQAPTR